MKRRLILLAVFSLLVLAVAPVAAEQRIPTSSITAAPAGASDVIVDGGFEGSYDPDAFGFGLNDDWDHTSVVYGNGRGFFNDPGQGHNGSDWYAVLGATGGAGTNEVATISQTVTLGTDSAELSFWLGCNGGDGDTLEVRVDGNVEYTDTCPSDQSWTEETVDLSAYADGGMHVLTFRGTDSQGGLTNWFIDDVALISTVALQGGTTCNGDNLEVVISAGDGLFNITGTGPGLPLNNVDTGTYSFTGPDNWTNVTIVETTGNTESLDTGNWTCPGAVFLNATAQCAGPNLEVVIDSGDIPMDISTDEGGVVYNDVGVGTFTIAGPGTFSNVTVTEDGGDQSVNLGTFDCYVDLIASASCDGTDVEVVINAGDGPFDIYENGALVHDDVAAGTYDITGAGSYTNVVVEETAGDTESEALGDFSCFTPVDLTATATCNGDDLVVDIQTGNAPFNIFADSGPVPLSSVGLGQTVLTGPATWTNLRVEELGLDYQSVNLGNISCGIPTVTITIEKLSFPGNGADFDFTGTEGDFQLDDAFDVGGDDGDAVPGYREFQVPVPGVYEFYELIPGGWDLGVIACDEQPLAREAAANAAQDIAPAGVFYEDNGVRIEAEEDTDVYCTFVNSATSNVTIFKDAYPPDGTDFSFSGDFGYLFPFEFTLDDAEPDDGDAYGNEFTIFGVAPGTYTFTETLPDDWVVGNDTACYSFDQPDVPLATPITVRDYDVTFELTVDAADRDYFCVIVNGQTSSIEIVKEASPEDGTDFDFESSFGGFTLDVDADPTYEDSILFEGVEPGSYAFQELVPPDWELVEIYCEELNGSPMGGWYVDADTLYVEPFWGEQWVCTFGNLETGSITIVKDAEPSDGTTFDFISDMFDPFMLADGESVTYDGLLPGAYYFEEFIPAGWTLSYIECDDPDFESTFTPESVTVDLDSGEDITCTFYNTQNGTINISKIAEPAFGDDFEFNSDFGTFYLDDAWGVGGDDGDAVPGTMTFSDLPTGTYFFEEYLPPGWELDFIFCDEAPTPRELISEGVLPPGTAVIDGTLFVDLEPGAEYYCTFVNLGTSSLTIQKETIPDGDGTIFEFETDVYPTPPPDEPTSFTLSDGGSWSTIARPGLYNVTEYLPDGWALASLYCEIFTPDNPPDVRAGLVSLDLFIGPDEDWVCTFENARLANVTIEKVTTEATTDVFDFDGDFGTFGLMDGEDIMFEVFPGEYDVYEMPPFGWQLLDVTCVGDDGVVYMPDGATLDVDWNENIICTFTNEVVPPMVTVIKDADYEDGTDFEFFAADFGPDGTVFYLDDADPDDGDGVDNTGVFDLLDLGTFSIVEQNLPPDWILVSIMCVGDDDAVYSANGVTLDLDPAEEVVCTFYNEIDRGGITIEKVTDFADDTAFEFSGDLGDFSLMDGEEIVYIDLVPGTYAVNEVVPASWTLASVVCDDPSGGTVTNATGAVIDLSGSEMVTCTFTNEADPGSITINKTADPADGTLFDFSGDLGDFSLSDGGSANYPDLTPGAYSITETLPDGWMLANITCDDGDVVYGTSGVDLFLDPGEDITCTFENYLERASLTIVKEAYPSDATEFSFDGDFGPFTLMDGESETFTDLLPGTYEVIETVPDGWALADIACAPAVDAVPAPSYGVIVPLGPGDDIVCTFTNGSLGSIVIEKVADPSDGTSFDFTGDLGAFSLMDGESAVFTALDPGSYTVDEVVPDPWTLADVTCVGDDNVAYSATGATLDLDLGENIICTFTNAQYASITITKEATPSDGTVFDFTSTLGDFSLADGESEVFDTLMAGTYSFTEVMPSDWVLTDISCSFGAPPAPSPTLDLTVGPGDEVFCTFSNAKKGTIIIEKDADEDNGTSFNFTGDLGAFSLMDGENVTFMAVDPGSYTVTETALDSWDEAVTCVSDDPNDTTSTSMNTAVIDMDVNETVTCTFTNTWNPGSADIVVTPPSQAAYEDGSQDSGYSVALAREPLGDVTITFSPDDQCTTSVPSVTFTSSNWGTMQDVTVMAVQDDNAEENPHPCVISHTATSAADPDYDGLPLPDVVVDIMDDDSAFIVLTPDELAVVEGEDAETYTVELGNPPAPGTEVTVDMTYDDTQITLDIIQIVFNETNWNVPVTVTVAGIDDGLDETATVEIVTHTASVSGTAEVDPAQSFDGVTAELEVTVEDPGGVTEPEEDPFEVPNLGLIMITTEMAQPAYMDPGGQAIPGIILPADADGNGFDTYVVTEVAMVGSDRWFGIFLGSSNWGWVPEASVIVIVSP